MFKPVIEPYSTLVLASDENFQVLVRLDYDNTYTVEVFDNVNNVVQKSVTGVSGIMVVEIGTPIDLGVPDGEIVYREVRIKDANGNIIASQILKLFYISTTNGDLNFKDKNGNDIIGEIAIADFKNGLVRRYYGSVVTIPGLDANSILDYSKMYIEFSSNHNGKYYYLAKISDIPTLGSSTIVELQSSSYYVVSVRYKIDISDNGFIGKIADYLVDSMGIFVNIIQDPNYWVINYQWQIAVWITKMIGLESPIQGVHYDPDTNILTVDYLVDPYDKLVIAVIIVALVVFGVVAVVFIDAVAKVITSYIYLKVSEINTQIINKTIEMKEKLVSSCLQAYSNDPQKLEMCLNRVDRLVNSTFDVYGKAMKDIIKQYNDKESELDKLKQILYVGGGIALVVSLISLAKK